MGKIKDEKTKNVIVLSEDDILKHQLINELRSCRNLATKACRNLGINYSKYAQFLREDKDFADSVKLIDLEILDDAKEIFFAHLFLLRNLKAASKFLESRGWLGSQIDKQEIDRPKKYESLDDKQQKKIFKAAAKEIEQREKLRLVHNSGPASS